MSENDKDKETDEKIKKALKGKAAGIHPKKTLKDIQKAIEDKKGKDKNARI